MSASKTNSANTSSANASSANSVNEDRYLIDNHKLHLHPERVAQWLAAGNDWNKQKKVYPIYVEISPSGNCNHRCTFCAVDYIGYEQIFLNKDALKRSISDMAEHGVKSIMYAGEGEPLLMKGIGEVINHTKAVGIDVAITTNATPLTDKLARECLGSVSWLKASVNAGSPEVYAKVHRTKAPDFDRVMGNLANAVKIREEMNLKTTLGAQTVLIPENVHDAFNLCEKSRAIGLDYVVIKPYSQHLKSTETMTRGYDKFQYRDQYQLADELAKLNTDKFKVIFRLNTMKHLEETERYYSKCYATPNFWAYIMASGDVYGCSAYLLDDRFKYGNINENLFSEIWEGERRRVNTEYVNKSLEINECRQNCRMENVNRYLWDLRNPNDHANFI